MSKPRPFSIRRNDCSRYRALAYLLLIPRRPSQILAIRETAPIIHPEYLIQSSVLRLAILVTSSSGSSAADPGIVYRARLVSTICPYHLTGGHAPSGSVGLRLAPAYRRQPGKHVGGA